MASSNKNVRMRRFTCELNEHEEGVASSDIIYNTIVRMRRFTCELNEHEEGVEAAPEHLALAERARRGLGIHG